MAADADEAELSAWWSLSLGELALIETKPPRSRLGFAAQLKLYRRRGRFAERASAIPAAAVHYLAEQAEASSTDLSIYGWTGRSGRRHREEILTFLGIRRMTPADRQELTTWIEKEICPTGTAPAALTEQVYAWCLDRKIQSPTARDVERLVRSMAHRFETAFLEQIAALVAAGTAAKLEEALAEPEGATGLHGLSEPLHLLVDSSGLKLAGAGEWLVEKHGTSQRRAWRKMHIGMDAEGGEIVALDVTRKEVDDGARTAVLLDQLIEPIASFTADGAYDQDHAYQAVAERHPDAAVIVPPRATAIPSPTAETEPTQRDRHLRQIAEHGRMGWRKASGYNVRSKVEEAISRYKRVIGDALRSLDDKRRATEVAIAAATLNHMLELGRPNYVRVA